MVRLATSMPSILCYKNMNNLKIYTYKYSHTILSMIQVTFYRFALSYYVYWKSVSKTRQYCVIFFPTFAQREMTSLKHLESPWKKINRRSFLSKAKSFAPRENYFLELKSLELN